jgi:hypothetical protein
MENAPIYQAFFFYEMINISFLDKIAQVLIEDYSESLPDTIVVLPIRELKFSLQALKKQVSGNILSEIISIEDFIQDIAEFVLWIL